MNSAKDEFFNDPRSNCVFDLNLVQKAFISIKNVSFLASQKIEQIQKAPQRGFTKGETYGIIITKHNT